MQCAKVALAYAIATAMQGAYGAQYVIECAISEPAPQLYVLNMASMALLISQERYRITYSLDQVASEASITTPRSASGTALLLQLPEELVFDFENKRVILNRRSGRFALHMQSGQLPIGHGYCEHLGDRRF